MELTGKLHAGSPVKEISEKFRKMEFVIEYAENPTYPQYISLQVINDRISLMNGIKVGDMLKIQFNLQGRQWTSPEGQVRYFNTLDAWKIERIGDEQQPAPQTVTQPQVNNLPESDTIEDEDDLPF